MAENRWLIATGQDSHPHITSLEMGRGPHILSNKPYQLSLGFVPAAGAHVEIVQTTIFWKGPPYSIQQRVTPLESKRGRLTLRFGKRDSLPVGPTRFQVRLFDSAGGTVEAGIETYVLPSNPLQVNLTPGNAHYLGWVARPVLNIGDRSFTTVIDWTVSNTTGATRRFNGFDWAAAQAQDTVVVTVPAKAGAVDGTTQNSDEFVWRLFTEFAAPALKSQPSPVVFETWASDEGTFSKTPHWPGPDEPKKLHGSVLGSMKAQSRATIDVPCNPPGNAAVGGFPTSGTPTPCIAEEVKRNRPQFDYIVKNNLNTQAGLAAAYARSFKVTMPTSAIAVKGDWVPVQTMLQWIPQLGDIANIEKLYYTTTSDSVEYALVALHVSSRQNPNWV